MNIRLMTAGAAVVLGGVALVAAQQPQQQPSQSRATQRATVVVYKSPT